MKRLSVIFSLMIATSVVATAQDTYIDYETPVDSLLNILRT